MALAETTRLAAPVDVLREHGRLSADALDRARRIASDSGEAIEPILTKLGLVSERDMAEAFSACLGIDIATLDQAAPDSTLLASLSPLFLRQFQVLPLGEAEGVLQIAMANPLDGYAADAIALVTGRAVARVVATATDIESALDRLLAPAGAPPVPDNGASQTDLDRLRDLASDAPVIRSVNAILTRAVDARASDIHIEPGVSRLVVRFRIDGAMQEVESPPLRLRDAIVSRVKIMARLNIAERRLPQDGRMSASVRGTEIDFRVSTLPTVHGESVVIRVLDREQVSLDFAALGFDDHALCELNRILALPFGILLVTGPTGSGKTTTLYAALKQLNTPERKLMTIEDPVEYQLEGVNQVQVQPQIGLSFAWALRSFLRQNPNIVMVGEIRDLETAQVAVQVALTGHMILSTLHTNDAASGVTRLLDMGVEDYLIVSTVNAILAQRLVRKLCVACRQPYEVSEVLASRLGLAWAGPERFFQAHGCAACGGTGYRGRTTLLEILPMTDAIRRLVLDHASSGELRAAAMAAGMRTMLAHGLEKARGGLTSLEEVLGATRNV
jgi:general secretion pathway protein E